MTHQNLLSNNFQILISQSSFDSSQTLKSNNSSLLENKLKKLCKNPKEINKHDEIGATPLYNSIIYGDIYTTSSLISNGANPNIQSFNGETPLYKAVDLEKTDQVFLLLQNFCDPNIQQKDGMTPLHLAVIRQNLMIIECLLKNKANPNIKDFINEQSPLHYAINCNKCDSKIIILLVQYKGNLNLKDKFGKSPIDYVKNKEVKNIIDKIILEQNKKNFISDQLKILDDNIISKNDINQLNNSKKTYDNEISEMFLNSSNNSIKNIDVIKKDLFKTKYNFDQMKNSFDKENQIENCLSNYFTLNNNKNKNNILIREDFKTSINDSSSSILDDKNSFLKTNPIKKVKKNCKTKSTLSELIKMNKTMNFNNKDVIIKNYTRFSNLTSEMSENVSKKVIGNLHLNTTISNKTASQIIRHKKTKSYNYPKIFKNGLNIFNIKNNYKNTNNSKLSSKLANLIATIEKNNEESTYSDKNIKTSNISIKSNESNDNKEENENLKKTLKISNNFKKFDINKIPKNNIPKQKRLSTKRNSSYNSNSFKTQNYIESDSLSKIFDYSDNNILISQSNGSMIDSNGFHSIYYFLKDINLEFYYDLFISKNIYSFNTIASELKNSCYMEEKDYFEQLGIKTPGHIYRIIIQIEITTKKIKKEIWNFIIENNNIKNETGINSSIYYCCDCCEETKKKNKNSENKINDLDSWLKKNNLIKYKKKFIDNGFDCFGYFILQMFSSIPIDENILKEDLGINTPNDIDIILLQLNKDVKYILSKIQRNKGENCGNKQPLLISSNGIVDEKKCTIF